MPRLPKLRDRPEPRIDIRPSGPHLVCVRTPGTQPRMSLMVFAGPLLNAVSGTTSTPPGVRWISAVAWAVFGAVRLPGLLAEEPPWVAASALGVFRDRAALRRPLGVASRDTAGFARFCSAGGLTTTGG